MKMARDEYLERSRKLTGYEHGRIPFPRVLQSMAEYFFTFGDEKDKELAEETRRTKLELQICRRKYVKLLLPSNADIDFDNPAFIFSVR